MPRTLTRRRFLVTAAGEVAREDDGRVVEVLRGEIRRVVDRDQTILGRVRLRERDGASGGDALLHRAAKADEHADAEGHHDEQAEDERAADQRRSPVTTPLSGSKRPMRSKARFHSASDLSVSWTPGSSRQNRSGASAK